MSADREGALPKRFGSAIAVAVFLSTACLPHTDGTSSPVPEPGERGPTLVSQDCYVDPLERLHIFMDVEGSALDLGPSHGVGASGLVRGVFADGSTGTLAAVESLEDEARDLGLTVIVGRDPPHLLEITQPIFVAAGSAGISAPSLAQLEGLSADLLGAGFEVTRAWSRHDGAGLVIRFADDDVVEEGWRAVGFENPVIRVADEILTKAASQIPIGGRPQQWLVFASRSALPAGWRAQPVTVTFDGLMVVPQDAVEVPIPPACIGSS